MEEAQSSAVTKRPRFMKIV